MIEQEFKIQATKMAPAKLVNETWLKISEAYCQPSRYYHNLVHLDHLLRELLDVKAEIKDWPVMIFSIAYHDYVYDVQQQDNEEQSAEIAVADLAALGVSGEQVNKCRKQIVATKTHEATGDADTQFLLDADLWILGAERETYKRYAEHIREEYKLYPAEVYHAGRQKVLEFFLKQQTIYKSVHFREKYESAARENLRWELETRE